MQAPFGATVLSALAFVLPAMAQEGDPAAGHELAAQLCAACHIVGTEEVGSDIAPPFQVIARRPGMTLARLHAWLGPGHPVLPHLPLTRQQTADINAYLDSLYEAPGEEEEGTSRSEPEDPPAAIEQSPPEKLGEPIEPSY